MTACDPRRVRVAEQADGGPPASAVPTDLGLHRVRPRPAARVALVVLVLLAAISYTWAIQRAALFTYYAAAVRSMSGSWSAFVFGGFDPAGWVTVDKLPGGFWIQALAVRLFGYSIYALVVPQVVAGLATVVVTFRMTQRYAGDAAGLIAAGVVVATPVSTALSRGNIPDAWSTLLLVVAADAVLRAITVGRRRSLLAAALCIALAFEVKMSLVWLPLVALGLGYLLAAGEPVRVRWGRTAAFGGVAVALSMSWIVILSLVPPGRRPWFDGSRDNSIFEQIFLYNGFGRIQGSPTFGLTTASAVAHGVPAILLTSRTTGPLGVGPVATAAVPRVGTRLVSVGPSWSRLLYGSFALGVAWLIPLAVVAGGYLLWETRRRPRTDVLRAATVIWLVWIATHVAVFSTISHLNAYYCAVLVPPIGALVGSGAVHAWRGRHRVPWLLPVALAGSSGYATALLTVAGSRWNWLLTPLWSATGVAALLLLVRPARPIATWSAAALAVTAVLTVPAVGSVAMDTHDGGPYTLGFSQKAVGPFREPAGQTLAQRFGSGEFARLLKKIEPARGSHRYLLATFGSPAAAPIIAATGSDVLPIGGYTGLMPFPTLTQLQTLVRTGQLRYISAPPHRGDERQKWVVHHCRFVAGYGIDNQGGQVPAQLYDCLPSQRPALPAAARR